jgi:hypothetical protein
MIAPLPVRAAAVHNLPAQKNDESLRPCYTVSVKTNPPEFQNVTVSLPGDLLREARHLAVDRGLSLSRFIAVLLSEQLQPTRDYEAARQRQLQTMANGFPLGIGEQITWTRDELHER